MLQFRAQSVAVRRPAAAAVVRPRVAVVVRSTPQEVDVLLEKALKDAKECDVTNKNCASQWDAVEELAAAKSHMKDAAKADPSLNDPLEQFCKEAPDADECRVYED